jgi:hypothetical protein
MEGEIKHVQLAGAQQSDLELLPRKHSSQTQPNACSLQDTVTTSH